MSGRIAVEGIKKSPRLFAPVIRFLRTGSFKFSDEAASALNASARTVRPQPPVRTSPPRPTTPPQATGMSRPVTQWQYHRGKIITGSLFTTGVGLALWNNAAGGAPLDWATKRVFDAALIGVEDARELEPEEFEQWSEEKYQNYARFFGTVTINFYNSEKNELLQYVDFQRNKAESTPESIKNAVIEGTFISFKDPLMQRAARRAAFFAYASGKTVNEDQVKKFIFQGLVTDIMSFANGHSITADEEPSEEEVLQFIAENEDFITKQLKGVNIDSVIKELYGEKTEADSPNNTETPTVLASTPAPVTSEIKVLGGVDSLTAAAQKRFAQAQETARKAKKKLANTTALLKTLNNDSPLSARFNAAADYAEDAGINLAQNIGGLGGIFMGAFMWVRENAGWATGAFDLIGNWVFGDTINAAISGVTDQAEELEDAARVRLEQAQDQLRDLETGATDALGNLGLGKSNRPVVRPDAGDRGPNEPAPDAQPA